MPIALLKILVVDDHQAMREMVKSMISDLVSEFIEAESGEDSLLQYRLHKPDLVLMDLSMPGMGGINATRLLVLEFPRARVIILTQHDQDVLRQVARKAGACGYVLKENLQQVREYIETPGALACM